MDTELCLGERFCAGTQSWADTDCSGAAFHNGGFHQCPFPIPFSQAEPDNDAYVRCSSRPCSPVHHEMHSKLSSSPPRSSPARLGPSYILKKGRAKGD